VADTTESFLKGVFFSYFEDEHKGLFSLQHRVMLYPTRWTCRIT